MATEQLWCAQCGHTINLLTWFELARQPDAAKTGSLWRFCSLRCVDHFVKGGDDA